MANPQPQDPTNTARELYLTSAPMKAANIVPGARVYVPIWRNSHVIGWGTATVSGHHATTREGVTWLVTLDTDHSPTSGTHAESGSEQEAENPKETFYFGYSIECAVCHGDAEITAECPQCGTGSNPWFMPPAIPGN